MIYPHWKSNRKIALQTIPAGFFQVKTTDFSIPIGIEISIPVKGKSSTGALIQGCLI